MPVVSPSSSIRHASSIDQDSAAAHAMPVSTDTICRPGISSNTPRADHRQHLHRHRVAVPDVHLEVVRGPPGALVHLVAARVQRDRQAGLGRGAQDRPVAAVRPAPAPACPGSSTCTKRSSPASRSISAHRQVGVLVRRADRAEQPRIPVQPLLARPVVQRAAHLGRELRRLLPEVLRLHRREDRVVDVVLVEQLLLRRARDRSPGSPPRGARRRGSRRCASAGTSRTPPRRGGRTPRGGAATASSAAPAASRASSSSARRRRRA